MTSPQTTMNTAEAYAEEMRLRLPRIVEATPDVVAMANQFGELIYLNSAGRSLLGIEANTPLTGWMLGRLHPAWAMEVVLQEALPTALRDGTWSGETALLSPQGKEIPVLQVILAHTDADGRLDFYSTICRSIVERKQKELETIEWGNRFEAAIRATGQVLFDWDTYTGEVTYTGDLEQLLGYSVEEMAGGLDRLRSIIYVSELGAFDAEVDRVLETREALHVEFRAVRKNGESIIIDAQGFFFMDRKGRLGRMVGFLKDVSQQRASEALAQQTNEELEERVLERTSALKGAFAEIQSRARQQGIVAHLGQRALAGIELDALMVEAARSAREGIGCETSAVLQLVEEDATFRLLAYDAGVKFQMPELLTREDAPMAAYALARGESIISQNLQRETRFPISPIAIRAGMMSGVSVCIQAGRQSLGVLNVFSRHPREYGRDDMAFLQALVNVLSAAIERQRTEESMRRAKAEAEAANRAKSEFLSRMSHELRTPLNAILGFTQILEMEEHTSQQAESIQHISRAGQNLLGMINEVLDIARIDSGRMQFHVEPIELGALLRDAANLTRSAASRQAITIHVPDANQRPAWAATDRERVKQVLLNFLSNAVKYNRSGGSVIGSITPSGADRWRISVRDTGPGIAQEKLAKLFVPFERLGQQEGGIGGGTGLGLALSQRLATALGGSIGVSSVLGEGSTFWIELPAGDPAVEQVLSRAPAPIGGADQETLVLYIEDDLANYELLARMLEPRRHLKLLSAIQGRIGLDLAKEHNPAIILLDLNLPDMSGEALIEQLKADPATALIPVLAVTGEVNSDRIAALQDLGAFGVLMKPYRIQELLDWIDGALGKRTAAAS